MTIKDENNMRVSFVITNLSSGGAERVISVIANYFAKQKNIDVKIIAVQDDTVDYPISENIEIIFAKRTMKKPFSIIERILDIRKNVKDSDVIISFLWHINVYTILATRFLSKKRVIISDRSDPRNETKDATKLQILARDFFYKYADHIVFQMPDAKSYYSNKIQNKSSIIANPISPNLPEVFIGERKKNIVAVCRLAPQKNLKMTIDAFKIFNKKHKDYTLTIYGEGELRNELEKYIKKNELEKVAFLPGFAKDIHQKIVDSAMYISSSDYEGISNSMLEALAMGIPTIATDCPVGGARMFIKKNYNGILIPTNDVNALVEGMLKIVEDMEFSNYLSLNAIKINEELSVERIGDQWLALL